MAISMGFTASLSDVVSKDQYFRELQTGGTTTENYPQTNPLQYLQSTYILVSSAGDIVYENALGEAQYIPGAGEGLYPIAATRILSSGVVNGSNRTTTGVVSAWFGDYKY